MDLPKLPDAPSTGRNRDVILEVLRGYLSSPGSVLEIGSGTGQHAVHFAAALPHLEWQTSELPENLPGVAAWLESATLPNTPPAIALDVTKVGDFPNARFDAVFTANTLHIMPWSAVESLFTRLPDVLAPTAQLIVYGPFNYGGQFTSDSNAEFNRWLEARDPRSGVRDFEAVDALATSAGLCLVEDRAMPANNRCLVWRR